jgi:alpha-amylase/alpha-mannosidase (GH57 family)
LKLYENPGVNDRLLKLFRRPCETLDVSEEEWVMRFVGDAHYTHQILPLPRYTELYMLSQSRVLSASELCEIEVLFLLAWCGNAVRSEIPFVGILLKQERGYGEDQKNQLIDTLCEFIKRIVPEYRMMMQTGQIALAINPMYHPIMPLLMDMKNAIHSRPETKMPSVTCVFEEDAYRHLENGIECFRENFQSAPQGIWPSEGSVNETTLDAYGRYGFGFAASDEEILFATLNNHERSLLYSPYRFKDEKGIVVVFRDKRLSDKIGFEYASLEPRRAVDDLMEELGRIYATSDEPLVSVILDGENAWESYPDNAIHFFNALYERLSKTEWCISVHLDEIARADTAYPVLSHIHPGSWIYRDFSTWIGQKDKNRAWEMLCQAHLAYQRHGESLSPQVREKIERELLIAEGSDWFWWYGTDHRSDYADLFDTLFRHRLVTIYGLLSLSVPLYLLRPNRSETETHSLIPTEWISPSLSAEDEPFFEWYGSGIVYEPSFTDVMDTSNKGLIRSMRYGFDRRFFYLSLEGRWDGFRNKELQVRLLSQQCEPIVIPLEKRGGLDRRQQEKAAGIISKRVQMKVPLQWLRADETFSLQVEVVADGKVVTRFPSDHASVLARYIERPYDWYI